MSHLALTILFTVLLFPAIFLVIIPMMPAMSYLFVMSLLYAVIDGFVHLQSTELLILGAIFFLSLFVDYFAGVLGARYAGASQKSIIAGFVGLVAGSVVVPPFGGLPGLFLAIFVTELFDKKGRAAAFKAAAGSLVGAVTGVVLNTILAITFFVCFVFFSFF